MSLAASVPRFLGEAFTKDYDLPNDTAYAETCASIGLMFFASRMLENEVKGTYGDVMERPSIIRFWQACSWTADAFSM